jgi:outer membrane protein assembly factor BamB
MTRLGLILLFWIPAFSQGVKIPQGTAWTQWGGPHRNFHTEAVGIAEKWAATGPKVLWKRPLGEGYSSLLVEGSTLWTMYGRGSEEVVLAADAATGKTRWEHAAPVTFRTDAPDLGNGPHATGLIAGDRLFMVGVAGHFRCLDKNTGKDLWSRNLWADYKGTRLVYGYASSPIAYRDLLILPAGGPGNALIAFRQADGSVAWKSQNFPNAYSSPMLINVDGLDQLVIVMDGVMLAVNPLNGDPQWSVEHRAEYGLNISSPVWGAGNFLFVSSEYDAGGRAIRLVREGNRVVAKQLWNSNRLRLHHGNAIALDGSLYFSNGGKGSVAIMTAIDAGTGKIHWQDRTFSKATFVHADGKLIVLDQDGDIALAKVSPQGIQVLARAPLLTSNAWTPPTLVGTRLYVRDRRQMAAVDLGGRAR